MLTGVSWDLERPTNDLVIAISLSAPTNDLVIVISLSARSLQLDRVVIGLVFGTVGSRIFGQIRGCLSEYLEP